MIQDYLLEEIKASRMGEHGFYVPTTKFALAMQLAHIQRHFIEEGIGLRQITDYCLLLKKSTAADRADLVAMMGGLGVRKFAAALMYVLQQIYNLDESQMLCPPDVQKGKMLLDEILGGGNFGWYREGRKQGGLANPMERKIHTLRRSSLYPRETSWFFIQSVGSFFAKLPQRIKYRTWSLQSIEKNKK